MSLHLGKDESHTFKDGSGAFFHIYICTTYRQYALRDGVVTIVANLFQAYYVMIHGVCTMVLYVKIKLSHIKKWTLVFSFSVGVVNPR